MAPKIHTIFDSKNKKKTKAPVTKKTGIHTLADYKRTDDKPPPRKTRKLNDDDDDPDDEDYDPDLHKDSPKRKLSPISPVVSEGEEEEGSLGEPDMEDDAESLGSDQHEEEDADGNVTVKAKGMKRKDVEKGVRGDARRKELHKKQKVRYEALMERTYVDGKRFEKLREEEIPDVVQWKNDPGAKYVMIPDTTGRYSVDEEGNIYKEDGDEPVYTQDGEVQEDGSFQFTAVESEDEDGEHEEEHEKAKEEEWEM